MKGKELKQKRAQTCLPSNKKNRTNDAKSAPAKNSSLNDSEGAFTSYHDSSMWEVKKSICRFLIENGHDFNVATSPTFKKMISLCLGRVECQIHSVKELKGSIFNDVVKEMDNYVNSIKSSWAYTGCSVVLDEWTDPKGRNLMNALVDCPKGAVYIGSYDVSDVSRDTHAFQHLFGAVFSEIGIKNVVQVVTNSTSLFKNELRVQLGEKCRSIFWTRSASCCIGLMLEKISAIGHVKETLDKFRIIEEAPVVSEYLRDRTDGCNRIRSSIPFRILENILLEKQTFTKMILSSDSMCTIEGKRGSEVIMDISFWNSALAIVKGAMPLVRVIDWLDENYKAQIGYIYETIDQAKETIRKEFVNKKSDYMLYWEIIDEVWVEQLHSPLHSAGYFLNPNLFYSSDFLIVPEVVTGLLRCVMRSTDDVRVLDKISLQLEEYQNARGCFSEGRDTDPSSVPPVEWWVKYGKGCPELQKLAIRILSQTCDGGLRFQLQRNLAENVTEEKGRNPSEQKELNKTTHLRYNMMLQNYATGKNSSTASEHIDLFADADISP